MNEDLDGLFGNGLRLVAPTRPDPRFIPTEDITAVNFGPQRWRRRTFRFRPHGERFDPSPHGVELLPEADARAFVETHHYSGSYPAARRAWGLFHKDQGLVGVAVLAVPMQAATGALLAPDLANPRSATVELSRLVLLDEVAGNAETWFWARVRRALRQELPRVALILSYSDPVIRRDLSGRAILPGHIGTVYQASNADYTGRGKPRKLVLAPSGEVISERALSKIRNGERGAAGAYQRLVAWGAPAIRNGEGSAAYVERALAEGPFRFLKHPGNHRYAWRLDGGIVTGAFGPYPTKGDNDGS